MNADVLYLAALKAAAAGDAEGAKLILASIDDPDRLLALLNAEGGAGPQPATFRPGREGA